MKLILTEKQSKMLAQILKEENYVQPEPQNPSMKSANKPYCINPDKVLIVKRFLDLLRMIMRKLVRMDFLLKFK